MVSTKHAASKSYCYIKPARTPLAFSKCFVFPPCNAQSSSIILAIGILIWSSNYTIEDCKINNIGTSLHYFSYQFRVIVMTGQAEKL